MNTFLSLLGFLLLGSFPCFAALDSTSVATQNSAAPALFSDAERAQNVAFWNAPNRYEIGARQGTRSSGVFVVRLTPEASIWFKAFNRALQSQKFAAAPSALPIATRTRIWEEWTAAKLAFDRALAAQNASRANAQIFEAPPAISGAGATPNFKPNPAPDAAGVAPLNIAPKPNLALDGKAQETTAPPTISNPAALPGTAAPQTPIAPIRTASPIIAPPIIAPPTIAPALPPHPGPIPPDLLATVGNAPPLAACVAPVRYTIRFESGEVFNFTDYILTLNPRNPSFRFAQGVASIGTALSKIAPDEVERIFAAANLSLSQTRVMRAVSLLEGGFDGINTYDSGFVSVGFIQFAALENGDGSLGELLRWEKVKSPLDFARDFHDFGIDVSADGLLTVLDPSSGAELRGGEAVRKIIDDKRLTAVFQLAGRRSVAFRAAQIEVAKANYYPADLPVEVNLNGQILKGFVRDAVGSEAGLATLFDRKVNVGNVRILNGLLAQLMLKHNLTRFEDVAPFERELILALKWRRDFLKDATLTQPA